MREDRDKPILTTTHNMACIWPYTPPFHIIVDIPQIFGEINVGCLLTYMSIAWVSTSYDIRIQGGADTCFLQHPWIHGLQYYIRYETARTVIWWFIFDGISTLRCTQSPHSAFLSHSASLAQNTLLMMSHSLIHLPPAHHSHLHHTFTLSF